MVVVLSTDHRANWYIHVVLHEERSKRVFSLLNIFTELFEKSKI